MDVDEPEILDTGPPGAERIPSFGTAAEVTNGRSWAKPLMLLAGAVATFVVVANVGGDTPAPDDRRPAAEAETEAESEDAEPLSATEVAAAVRRGASGVDEWYRLRLPEELRVESVTTGHDDDLLLLVTDGARPPTRTLLSSTDGETWTGNAVSAPTATTSENVVMSLDSGGLLLAESDGAGFVSLDGGASWTVHETFQRSQVRSLERFGGARVGDVAVIARLEDDARLVRIDGTAVDDVELAGPVLAIASDAGGFTATIRVDELTTGIFASADGLDWAQIDVVENPVGVLLADNGVITRPSGTLGLLLEIGRVDGAGIAEIPNTFAGTSLAAAAASGDRIIVLGSGIELTATQRATLQQPIVIPENDGRDATLAVGGGADGSFLFDGTAIGAGTRTILAETGDEPGVRFTDTEEDSFLEILDLETGDLIARFSAMDFERAFEAAFGDLDRVFGAQRSVLQTSDDAGVSWRSIELADPGFMTGTQPPTLLTTPDVSAIVGSDGVLFRPTNG